VSAAAALLAEVAAAGARLKMEDGKLVVTGNRLPAALVERLRGSKVEALAALAPLEHDREPEDR
jgi:hypothetical protein